MKMPDNGGMAHGAEPFHWTATAVEDGTSASASERYEDKAATGARNQA
jgi:hypothetical protein